MFATIVVVLPSQYQGGEVHVSHGRRSKVFDASPGSLYMTTALAWYTDVVHEVKPVMSGFRLALSFNLIRNSTVSVPKAPSLDGPMLELERVLSAWRRADTDGTDPATGEDSPQKLAYILDHKYSQANLSFDKLKGRDRSLVQNVKEACEQLGFQLALGSLDYYQCGAADDDDGYYGRGGRDVTMAEVGHDKLTVQLFAGPKGEYLGGKTELDEEELMVDEDYWSEQSPDRKEYEGYQGNVSCLSI